MALLRGRACLKPRLGRSLNDRRSVPLPNLALRRGAAFFKASRGRRRAPHAQGENSESVSSSLTEDEARRVLGVGKDTSFDEIVKTKNRLLLASNLTQETIQEIQLAYDLLLMKSMAKRVERSDDVPHSVRYADVQKRDFVKEAQKALAQIPTGGVVVQNPSQEVMRSNSIVLGILALSLLPQGVSPMTETVDIIPGVQLALGCAWSVYSLRQYRLLGLGRAMGYTLGGLVMGGILGGALESLIHIQQHPIGGFHSPATLIGEFSLIGIWACATFLG